MDERGDSGRFREVLSDLKEQGCTALVTGDAPEEVFEEISTNFLGGHGERRARVFGLVGRDVEVARRRLRGAGPGYEPALVVHAMPDPPRTAAAAGPELNDRALAVRRTDYSLSALEAELVDALHDARQLHGPFQPAELRVGVDSLQPLAERNDLSRLSEFLDAVTDTIVEAGGMGYFAFPGDRTGPAVRSLASAFDLLIEFRNVNDRVEQRWTFRDRDLPAPWMQV